MRIKERETIWYPDGVILRADYWSCVII